MPRHIRMLVIREYICECDPACCVHQKYILVPRCNSLVDNVLILALEVLPNTTISIWPTPRSKYENRLVLVDCTKSGNEVQIHLNEAGICDRLGCVVSADMYDKMRERGMVPREIPRRSKVVVRCEEKPSIFRLEKLE